MCGRATGVAPHLRELERMTHSHLDVLDRQIEALLPPDCADVLEVIEAFGREYRAVGTEFEAHQLTFDRVCH